VKLKSALIPILFLLLAGCSSSDTVARVKSPSGRVEAILDETNGGATTSFGYVVSLKATSAPATEVIRVANAYGAVRSDRAYGVNLVWVNEHILEIQYLEARWAKVERAKVLIDGVWITIRLKSGVRDETAPAGGMLDNIEQRQAARAFS